MLAEKLWQQGHRQLSHRTHRQEAGRDECLSSAGLLFTTTPDSQSGWAFPPTLNLSGHTLADVLRNLPPLVILNPVRLITKNNHLMGIL